MRILVLEWRVVCFEFRRSKAVQLEDLGMTIRRDRQTVEYASTEINSQTSLQLTFQLTCSYYKILVRMLKFAHFFWTARVFLPKLLFTLFFIFQQFPPLLRAHFSFHSPSLNHHHHHHHHYHSIIHKQSTHFAVANTQSSSHQNAEQQER